MDLIKRHTELSANIVAFCRFLRSKSFSISISEERDALEAFCLLPLENAQTMQLVLKSVLTKNLYQAEQFDALYKQYWKEVEKATDAKIKEAPPEQKDKKPTNSNKPSLLSIKNWLYGKKNEELTEIATYSPNEVLTKKDFAHFTPEELQEVNKIVHLLARNLAIQASRRKQKTAKMRQLDIRNTLYRNRQYGGEILKLAYTTPKLEKFRLVLICDVSKSMDLYSRFLIQFMYAFQAAFHRIETFVFSTSLHKITAHLQRQHINQTLQKLADNVPNWSGGTQIGLSLKTFFENDYRLLDKKTTVIILSDGWDTGETTDLEESMKSIHKKARKLIWLNPLAGNPNYAPTTEGMKAAMPYIDAFASVHNIESLRNLWKIL
ncbi:MAG: VWA domain-containing protein [Cytophagales bacterium]|nr:MAG: VWA domain-containing protein [Cytophagales bacterium]